MMIVMKREREKVRERERQTSNDVERK